MDIHKYLVYIISYYKRIIITHNIIIIIIIINDVRGYDEGKKKTGKR
jgi:hypothetical protein